VFKARTLSLLERRAFKLMSAERVGDPVFRALFAREAFAAAQAADFHLVELREVGHSRNRDYAAMEWIEGVTLAEILERRGRVDPRQAAAWVLQAARGLRTAHALGLIHRDVKPGNIWIDREGRVKVDDLGLEVTPSVAAAIRARELASARSPGRRRSPSRTPAGSEDAGVRRSPDQPSGSSPGAMGGMEEDSRSTRRGGQAKSVGTAVGSPLYVAPELIDDPLTSDGRADLYALGGVFYHLVTGRPPFPGATAAELIEQHRTAEPVPPAVLVPGLPDGLDAILATMLRKRPVERYPSALVVIEVLERWLGLPASRLAAADQAAAKAVRLASQALEAASSHRLRGMILRIVAAIWLTSLGVLTLLGLFRPALVIAVLGLLTASLGALKAGWTGRSEVARLVTELVLGEGLRRWLFLLLAVLAAGAALGAGTLIFVFLAAGVLAAIDEIFVARPGAAEARAAAEEPRRRFRELRACGWDELWLASILLEHGGESSDQLGEALLGRRDWRLARARLGRQLGVAIRAEPALGVLRQAVVEGLEARLRRRRDRRAGELIRQAQEALLESEGVNLLTARRRARRIARACTAAAAFWREHDRDPGWAMAGSTQPPLTLLDRLRLAEEDPESSLEQIPPPRRLLRDSLSAAASALFGPTPRAIAGGALVVGFAIWVSEQGIVAPGQFQELTKAARIALERSDPSALLGPAAAVFAEWRRADAALELPWLPPVLVEGLNAANLGLAGCWLLLSSLGSGGIAAICGWAAAAITLYGARWGLALPPDAWSLDPSAQARLLGGALLAAGPLFHGVRGWARRRVEPSE
jgi:hypothetical protein